MTPDFLMDFAFECLKGHKNIWWIEKSVQSSTLWELHTIIVFMYTTLAIIVMSSIPFKYERFKKTQKELEKDKKEAEKKAKKKESKKKMKKMAKLERFKQKTLETLMLKEKKKEDEE